MAKKNYLPRQDAELDNWLANFSAQLTALGPALGIPAAEITTLNTKITTCRNDINNVVAKKAELRSVIGNKELKKSDLKLTLLPMVQRIKNMPAYKDDDQGKRLGIVGSEQTIDLSSLKPVLKVVKDGGKPRIEWTKGQADALNIYVDRRDGKGLTFLATDTQPDYIDTYPIPPDRESAEWDYVGIYMADDNEVGQPSEKVSVFVNRKG
jgi:hypothetical protein